MAIEFDQDEVLALTPTGLHQLRILANTVYSRYYRQDCSQHYEDLISCAMLKAIDLIKKGMFDPERASLRNYIFTGMRNQMGGYRYHQFKVDLIDDYEVGDDYTSYEGFTPMWMSEPTVDDYDDLYFVRDAYINPAQRLIKSRMPLLGISLSQECKLLGLKSVSPYDPEYEHVPESDRFVAYILWKLAKSQRAV